MKTDPTKKTQSLYNMITYHRIQGLDYNNPRTQNIILYIIYNNKQL